MCACRPPDVVEGVEDPTELVDRSVNGHQAVRPAADLAGGLLADGGAEDRRWGRWQAPDTCAVDGDEAVVGDLVAAKQRPDHVNALEEASVTDVLVRPLLPGHVLVEGLTRAEDRPEAAGEKLGERGDGLGDDRRVVTLPGGGDDAERD